MTDEKTLDRIVNIWSETKDLYKTTGFMACHNDGVQASKEFVLSIHGELKEIKRNLPVEYPYEISKIYKGVKFYSVEAKPTTRRHIVEATRELEILGAGYIDDDDYSPSPQQFITEVLD